MSRDGVEAITDCTALALWVRSRGLERGVLGYDHADKVGRVPRDDVIHEPCELTVRAAAVAAAARSD
jgi:hypothetical protein